MKKLFLDDTRNPNEAITLVVMDKNLYLDNDWFIVREYREFVNWVEENGMPDYISFDHDLGLEHIKFYFNNGGHENPPDPSTANFKEESGYDAAKWLVDYCYDNGVKLPKYQVHSANPIGRENIEAYLRNASKHLGV